MNKLKTILLISFFFIAIGYQPMNNYLITEKIKKSSNIEKYIIENITPPPFYPTEAFLNKATKEGLLWRVQYLNDDKSLNVLIWNESLNYENYYKELVNLLRKVSDWYPKNKKYIFLYYLSALEFRELKEQEVNSATTIINEILSNKQLLLEISEDITCKFFIKQIFKYNNSKHEEINKLLELLKKEIKNKYDLMNYIDIGFTVVDMPM